MMGDAAAKGFAIKPSPRHGREDTKWNMAELG
jgi:hypothetical protein